jgi:hypothetical protein
MGSRLYRRFNILPGVSWCGSLMAISAGLAGGCDHKPAPPKFHFVELVKVTGQCWEDHVQQSEQADNYVGEIVHYYDPATGRHMRDGSVDDVERDNVERIAHEVKDPAWYAPPSTIWFGDLSADDIAGVSLTLHGISQRQTHDGESYGYHSTCRLNVTERSDHPPTPPKASR